MKFTYVVRTQIQLSLVLSSLCLFTNLVMIGSCDAVVQASPICDKLDQSTQHVSVRGSSCYEWTSYRNDQGGWQSCSSARLLPDIGRLLRLETGVMSSVREHDKLIQNYKLARRRWSLHRILIMSV
jgi:hypothetical protein